MKHIKLFETSTDYQAFKSSDKFVLPNVSFVKVDNTVLYEPIPGEEIIEYHFDIPMENSMEIAGLPGGFAGQVNGDYSSLCNTLREFAKKYGFNSESHPDCWTVSEEIFALRANITVNEFKAIDMFVEPWGVAMCTNAPVLPGGSNEFHVTDSHLYFEHGSNSNFPA